MKRNVTTWHSRYLDKDMTVISYGEKGLPVLGFPTQDSMAGNWEDFGMVEHLRPYIEAGRIQLFTVDSVDRESWSLKDGIDSWRTARQESYYNYIIEEVLPFIRRANVSGRTDV